MAKRSKLNEHSVDCDPDRELVDRVLSGEVAPYRDLVERYQSRLFAVALGVIGNPADAEEIVQESFVKAYKNLKSFKGQASFYTWIYRIVANMAIDFSRKRYRRAEASVGDIVELEAHLDEHTPLGSPSVPLGSPELELERKNIRQAFSKALEGLSPEHRTVIVLREIEGLSYGEMSEVIGCSKGTVMSRLHHARTKLRSAFSGLGFDEFREKPSKQEPDSVDSGGALKVTMVQGLKNSVKA